MAESTGPQLRRATLAVSVLHDIDLLPANDGIVLDGRTPVTVSWEQCAGALRGAAADSAEGIARLARWLRARRWIADRPVDALAAMARPVGLPHGHLLHPGAGWVRVRVLGNSLDLGLGLVGLDPGAPDDVVVVPQSVLDAAGLTCEANAWWDRAQTYLEEMGALVVARMARLPGGQLRPMGDCDAVTLLGSATLRSALCSGSAAGMHAVIVPMRSRGWVELSRIDPAFGAAAAAATSPEHRGFARPVLLTAEEVSEVAAGGTTELVLRDPAAADPTLGEVLYR